MMAGIVAAVVTFCISFCVSYMRYRRKNKAEETHEGYPAYATPGQELQHVRTEYPAQPLQSGAPQP